MRNECGCPSASSRATRALVFILLAALAFTTPRRGIAADGQWFSPAPDARTHHGWVHDPIRGRMLIFGGVASGGRLLNDVWSFDLTGGGTWQRVPVVGSPPSARAGHTTLYDPTRDRLLVYGGETAGGLSAEVWELALAGSPTWTQLSANGTPPGARGDHSAILDPVRDRMIVFGGLTTAGPTNEVWALALGAVPMWSKLSPSGTIPVSRSQHGALYDAIRDRMVVFGGLGSTGARSDVTALSLSGAPAWSPVVATGTPPPARYAMGFIHDTARDRFLIMGGSGSTPYFDDLWSLTLGTTSSWSVITPTGTRPRARAGAGVTALAVQDRLVLMGGSGANGTFGDVWSLSLVPASVFAELTPGAPIPTSRHAHGMIHDSGRDRLVLFGGSGPSPTGNDLWAYALDGSAHWTRIQPAGAIPSSRAWFATVHDPVRSQMLVIGGFSGSTRLNEVWSLSLAGATSWIQLAPAGDAFTARALAKAIYDPIRDRVLVFGGLTAAGDVNELWELSFAGVNQWTRLTPLGTPPEARDSHALIYDPVRDRMLLFGGSHQTITPFVDFNDVWALSLGVTPTWTQLTPQGAPPTPRLAMSATYDPVGDRMLVFGGLDGSGALAETWQLSLTGTPTWSQLSLDGPVPGARYNMSLVRDSARGKFHLFGGSVSGQLYGDLWTLTPAGLLDAPAGAGTLDILRAVTPMPARSAVTIHYALGSPGRVRLGLFDLQGREVCRLIEGDMPAGKGAVRWDGRRSGSNQPMPAGVYFARLETQGSVSTRRVVLVR